LPASDPGVDHPQIPVFLDRNRQDDAVRPENRVDRTRICSGVESTDGAEHRRRLLSNRPHSRNKRSSKDLFTTQEPGRARGGSVAMARNTQRLRDHTCPFCGTDYSVDAHANGRPAYHTAICSACGDVMAEWHGKSRCYRRKRSRPNPKRRAAAIVAIAAETAKREPARSRRGAAHKGTRARQSGHEGSRKSRRA
jgi:hypothetical protein